jgi:hypothetical protein
VAVRLVYESEFVVLAIIFQVLPPSVEDSHCKIFPVDPPRESVAPFDVAQTVASADSVPATVCGFTVIVTVFVATALQLPLCTIALYKVVAVRLV